MVNVSIARRYARALNEVAAESGSSDKVLQTLEGFTRLMEQNPDFKDVLVNPAYSRTELWGVVEKVLGAVGGGEIPNLTNFFRLLIDRNRLASLPDITRIYREFADQRAGRVRGKVTSAKALPPESVERLQEALTRLTQRNVVLEAKVDPTLIGGVSTQIGPVMYDGSLRSQLQGLRESLKRA